MSFLKDKFSLSKLKVFAQCPRKAYYRYIERLKEVPSPALLAGRAVHAGQEFDNLRILRMARPSLADVLDVAVAELEVEAKKAEVEVGLDVFVAGHSRQLAIYEKSGERAKIVPRVGSVEAAFQLEIKVGEPEKDMEPALLEGFVDVVSEEDGGVVVDYKSVGRPVSAAVAGDHMQLALEALGSNVTKGKIVSFVAEGKQHATTKIARTDVSKSLTDKLLGFLASSIYSFRRSLRTGDWPRCDPASFYCSKAACTFYDRCYPAKNLELTKYIQVGRILVVGKVPAQSWRQSAVAKRELDAEAGKETP